MWEVSAGIDAVVRAEMRHQTTKPHGRPTALVVSACANAARRKRKRPACAGLSGAVRCDRIAGLLLGFFLGGVGSLVGLVGDLLRSIRRGLGGIGGGSGGTGSGIAGGSGGG